MKKDLNQDIAAGTPLGPAGGTPALLDWRMARLGNEAFFVPCEKGTKNRMIA